MENKQRSDVISYMFEKLNTSYDLNNCNVLPMFSRRFLGQFILYKGREE